MKKTILKLILTITVTVFVSSCKDDDSSGSTCSDGIQNGDETGIDCGGSCNDCPQLDALIGDVTEDLILDAAIAYKLNGAFVVKSGSSLTIPAGTTIKATGGTAAYIAVEQGAQIFINGTSANPVVMTSGEVNPTAGNWGGLVIAGNAPTNKGTSVTSEVADLTYGGNVPTDNSGSIRYLRIEYTGATYSNDKEFNGVSLFGVGSGTTFEYVQSYNGGDDGIE
ncbi:hypothetical protein MWU65_12485, partial [Cellulophaga sp. F20128]|nr:hypothetical protein [Cellulophaga sp. F20128]